MTKAVTSVSVNDSGTAVVAFDQAEALRWGASTGVRPCGYRGAEPAGVGISAFRRFTALATNTTDDGPGNRFELTLFGPRSHPGPDG